MARPFPLQDKVAIITGASGGLGHRIAQALGVAGAKLVLTGKTPKRLRRAHEMTVAMGVPEDHVISLSADLTDSESAEAVVNAARERFGGLDILINSAGVGVFKAFPELTLDEFNEVIGSNFTTAVNTTHFAMSALIASRGHVINIGSGLSKRGAATATAYAAAKFALQGFSESLRLDLARHGVRVSCIHPAGAGVNTGFWDRADPNVKRGGMLAPERLAEAVLVILTMRDNALIDDITVRTS